jgi:cell wall-associated NlpC family hydrolase
MTAALPSARPASAGRHRAPDEATTGSLGPIPAERQGRGTHHAVATAPLQRAARTAGLSLAALGALAGAGGVASHQLVADEPAPTGEFALPAQLAASDLALPAVAAPVAAPIASAVMPVISPAVAPAAAPQIKTVSAATKKAAAAKPAAKPSSEDAEAAAAGSSLAAKALSAAKSEMGTPYVWGGTSPKGFDCSGLMQWAFKQAGKSLPRTSAAQSQVGQKISTDELRPGDLVFFYSPVSHVAMYAGNGMVVEAPTEGQDVKLTKLSKLEKNMVSARRV